MHRFSFVSFGEINIYTLLLITILAITLDAIVNKPVVTMIGIRLKE